MFTLRRVILMADVAVMYGSESSVVSVLSLMIMIIFDTCSENKLN